MSFISLDPALAGVEFVSFTKTFCMNVHVSFPALSTLRQLYCLPDFYWNRLAEFDWSSTSG